MKVGKSIVSVGHERNPTYKDELYGIILVEQVL